MVFWASTKRLLLNRNVAKVISFSTNVKESLIYLGSQKINYLKVGDGPKNIMCFPGALGTIWTDFKPQIEGLDRKEFTIYVWEQPGHGKSRPPERHFTSNLFQEDADYGYEFAKALGLKSFSILGWSDGGSAGTILAAKYPEVVDNLVVWGCVTYATAEDLERFSDLQDIDNWSENAKKPLLEIYGEKVLRDMQNGIYEANRNLVKEGGEISSKSLSKIKCPTLILYGAKDPMVNLEQPKFMLENIKGSKLHIFPEGKHNIHIRYAKEFNDMVTKFILKQTP